MRGLYSGRPALHPSGQIIKNMICSNCSCNLVCEDAYREVGGRLRLEQAVESLSKSAF